MVKRLSHDDRARIAAAVKEAEARTEARLAVVIVPVSDRYHLVPVLTAAVIAMAVEGVMALVWPELPLRRGFAIAAALFIVLSLVLDWLPLRLMLVPRHIKQVHAANLAHREFAARVLSHPERSGILFFVSLGEKYAHVLADHRLHEAAGELAFDAVIADFVRQIKVGETSAAIINAVEACGRLLAQHRPNTAL